MQNPHNIGIENQSISSQEISKRVSVIRVLYFLYFAAFGIVVTYLNVFYRDSGLSGVQIGILSSLVPLISIVSAPIWGGLSDHFGRVRQLLMVASAGMIVAISGIGLANAFVWLGFFTLIYAFFDSSVLTILDSTTLRSLGNHRDRFGRERVWGSVGFIVSAWGVGFILEKIGSQWFFIFIVLIMLGVLFTLFWLPNTKASVKSSLRAGVSKLLLRREWLIFSFSLMLAGLGNFAINGFLGIYIKDLGGSEGLIGTAAALATITELPIMFWSSKILKRFSPWQLLMVSYGATAVRLIFYGVMPSAIWVIPASILHSLTFGVYWIATVAFVDQMATDEIKSSAQGMLYAVLNVSRMLASLVVGYLYDLTGAGNLFLISAVFSFFAMALFWLNRSSTDEKNNFGGVV